MLVCGETLAIKFVQLRYYLVIPENLGGILSWQYLLVRGISSYSNPVLVAANNIWQRGYVEREKEEVESCCCMLKLVTSAICNSGNKSKVVKISVKGEMTGVLEERKEKTLMGQFLR